MSAGAQASIARAGAAVTLTGSFSYGEQALFDNLHLELPGGCWTCLLGQSGIGKSTLLRLLAGLPTGGQFSGSVNRNDLPGEIGVAYMAQSDLLAPWLNVIDNVMMGARLRGQRPDRERARHLLDRVGLEDHWDKRPSQLSGGMRQRVALARTLMERAPLVLLDEPFSALDARTRADMQELAFELLGGATVLLATHDPGEAVRLAHQIYLLSDRGLVSYPVPDGDPARPVNDMAVLQHQAGLLDRLRSEAA